MICRKHILLSTVSAIYQYGNIYRYSTVNASTGITGTGTGTCPPHDAGAVATRQSHSRLARRVGGQDEREEGRERRVTSAWLTLQQCAAMGLSYLEEMRTYFESHNKQKEYVGHNSKVHTIGWNADGRRLASGSYDKCVTIFVFDGHRETLRKDYTYKGHGDSVDQLCWHPTHSEQLTSASGDKTVRIWDTRTHKCSATINTKGENINITWSPDGQTIAVGNKEDLVSFIDVRSQKIRHEQQFKFEVNELSWNNTNDLFYLTNAQSGQGYIHIYNYPEMELVHSIHAHPGNCICIKFEPQGRYFATGSADALVSIWDVQELYCKRTLPRLEWPVRTLSFSSDGQLLASGSEDQTIDVAHVETGEQVAHISVTYPTFTLAWTKGI
ncbi:THO complex subunit 3 [Portunus trituberculatus]|uniref:THO complex subunit 3 n=1 Tax=Portunus trituberculatus TaxID=210409 RepID=A0A5B7FBE9_PORTR|nr:THO complex subunit 3 [Portunus trituberculatus]